MARDLLWELRLLLRGRLLGEHVDIEHMRDLAQEAASELGGNAFPELREAGELIVKGEYKRALEIVERVMEALSDEEEETS